MASISIPQVAASINKYWNPNLVAVVNDHHVKIVRIDGDFIWHSHPDSDELFYVLEGKMQLDIENDNTKSLSFGDMFVVPKGVRHRPRAEKALIMVIEQEDTVNTGDQESSERTATVKDARHILNPDG